MEPYFLRHSIEPSLSQVISAMTCSRLSPVMRRSKNSLFVSSLGNLCSQYMQFTAESNENVQHMRPVNLTHDTNVIHGIFKEHCELLPAVVRS